MTAPGQTRKWRLLSLLFSSRLASRPEQVVPECLTSAISRRGRAALQERQRPLSVEIVADVVVAIAGIEPETAVQRER
jgi:hypothetical protein